MIIFIILSYLPTSFVMALPSCMIFCNVAFDIDLIFPYQLFIELTKESILCIRSRVT
jgi:hypothetical protein